MCCAKELLRAIGSTQALDPVAVTSCLFYRLKLYSGAVYHVQSDLKKIL